MKLLSKNEITKAVNADKMREIAEGLKISRKVDSLRELATKEEEKLSNFRNESLSVITKEISDLNSKKESLQKELSDTRRELSKETTLTREERINLEKLKRELEEKEKNIDDKSYKLRLQEIDIGIALKDSKDALLRAENHEEEATRLHLRASNEKIEADNNLIRARKIEEDSNKLRADLDKEYSLREDNILRKENENKLKEEENLDTQRELENEKIRLADQRATLERSLDRLRKNRLG